ncbi:MAG: IS110 family transposase [Anaerolineaceae bacterium]|nr:MAG: IS110 family transposase [Anaerolineaceae bacterium]
MKTIIGIDWSEKKHCVHAYNESGAQLLRLEVAATVTGFRELTRQVNKLNSEPVDCLVAIETAHNLLVDYLHDLGYTLYILAPSVVSSNRGRQGSSGAKDDDRDALLLAEILRTDLGQLVPWQPDGHLVRQMRILLTAVDQLTKSIVRQRNRLRAHLLRFYPQALDAFENLQTQFSLRFLTAFPGPGSLETVHYEQFAAFCRQQGYYEYDRYPELWSSLCNWVPRLNLQENPAFCQQVAWQADRLLTMVLQKKNLINQVQSLFQQHADAFIFDSLPGTGALLAPKLLVMFGDHRQRYPTRSWLPAIAGTAPVTVASGKSRYVKFRRACNHDYRNTAQQFANSSIRKSAWAATYFHQARDRGQSKSHAYRCLANRWLHIIWALWQRREAYDEAYHLHQVSKHRRVPS